MAQENPKGKTVRKHKKKAVGTEAQEPSKKVKERQMKGQREGASKNKRER